MPAPQLIVCEKSGKWAAALRSLLDPGVRTRLYETRLLEHCDEQLVERPNSIVAIEQTWTNYASVMELVNRVQRRLPAARTIILDETNDPFLSRTSQMAGAIHVTHSRLNLRDAARLITRHLSRYPAQPSSYEELLGRLPWGN